MFSGNGDFDVEGLGAASGLACLAGAVATIFLSRDVWRRRQPRRVRAPARVEAGNQRPWPADNTSTVPARARVRAREAAGNQRPWPADKEPRVDQPDPHRPRRTRARFPGAARPRVSLHTASLTPGRCLPGVVHARRWCGVAYRGSTRLAWNPQPGRSSATCEPPGRASIRRLAALNRFASTYGLVIDETLRTVKTTTISERHAPPPVACLHLDLRQARHRGVALDRPALAGRGGRTMSCIRQELDRYRAGHAN